MGKHLYEGAGERIRKARMIKGYSRGEFARKAGISSKFVYEIEEDRKGFSADILLRVANALDVSCDYILTGKCKKGEYDEDLMEAIELFDVAHTKKLVRLLNVIHDFMKEQKTVN